MSLTLMTQPDVELTPITRIMNDDLYYFFKKDSQEIIANINSGNYQGFKENILEFFQKNSKKQFPRDDLSSVFSQLLILISPAPKNKVNHIVRTILTKIGWCKDRQAALNSIAGVISYIENSNKSQYPGFLMKEYLQDSFAIWGI